MSTGSPQRIMASAPRWRRMGLAFALIYCGSFVFVGGGIALAHFLLAVQATGPLLIIGALGAMAMTVYGMVPRPLPLDLWPDRLVVDEGRIGVFPLAGLQLGSWKMPGYGVDQGSVLLLTQEHSRFCLGGRDHKLPVGFRPALEVESVDAYVAAPEFDGIVERCTALLAYPTPTGHPVVRCSLVPNRASPKSLLRTTLPWLATMLLLGAIGAISGALGLLESSGGRVALVAVAATLVCAGIGLTVVRAARTPTAALVLQLDPAGLRLFDARSGTLLAAADDSQVQVLQTKHTTGGRATVTLVGVIVGLPGSRTIHIGVPDPRFAWRDDVADRGTPEFVVGSADWLALVERFHLLQHLAGSGSAGSPEP